MNDIDVAKLISEEVGKFYEQGRSNTRLLPPHALTCFRSLANVICNALDKEVSSPSVLLLDKIRAIQSSSLLKRHDIDHLHTLRLHGNKGVHPEDFPEADFPLLAVEAEAAAMALVRTLYPLFNNKDLPDFEIADVATGELQRITYKAMVERDVDAMYRSALFLQNRALQGSENYTGPLRTFDHTPFPSVPDLDQAMYWFKLCADKGHVESMYRLGQYKAKHRIEHEDPDFAQQQGERLLSQAAEQGNADALHSMGGLFFHGSSLYEKDHEAAIEYFEKAAELNHPGSLAQLGHMYASGKGCKPNHKKAAEYSLRAAEAGFPQGQYNTFLAYRNGEGFDRDHTKSLFWLELAVKQDLGHAKYMLAQLILLGEVEAGPEYDPKALLTSCAHLPELAPYALMSLAEIRIEEKEIEAWVQATFEIQESHRLFKAVGAPKEEMTQCLRIAKAIAGKLKSRVLGQGANQSTLSRDLIACGLFDSNGIPVDDKDMFIGEVTALYSEARTNPSAQERLQQLIRSRAHIKQRTTAVIPKAVALKAGKPAAPKVGRNDDCPCGKPAKYKKCCWLKK